jgi:hypothetical protein
LVEPVLRPTRRQGKLPLAELRALRGQNRTADFQSQPSKPNQSYLGHSDGEEPRAT